MTTIEPIRVYVPDATYPDAGEGPESTALSASFRRGLEAEFELAFEEANIGAGFDIPAFVAEIPVAAWIGAALLSGKVLEESLHAYLRLYQRLRSFFHRKPAFDRNGAAIVAIGKLADHLGSVPPSIEIVGYDTIPAHIPEERQRLGNRLGMADAPEASQLGMLTHVFDIKAGDETYRIFVTGAEVEIEHADNSPPMHPSAGG